jgi:redox-sensitive bicupin YhaK (pirin superfamily)
MFTKRPAGDRGHGQHGWLDTRHTFSFNDYYDPAHMDFRALRVINEDRVQPAEGFGTHGHRDMEIVTYVLDGALAHKDSLGTGSVLRPGELQAMTAGTASSTRPKASRSTSTRFGSCRIGRATRRRTTRRRSRRPSGTAGCD